MLHPHLSTLELPVSYGRNDIATKREYRTRLDPHCRMDLCTLLSTATALPLTTTRGLAKNHRPYHLGKRRKRDGEVIVHHVIYFRFFCVLLWDLHEKKSVNYPQ
jgi:hypothetical protein